MRAADSVERVYVGIKELAADYHFRPSEKINEVELAARLSVSRTPVQAALNRLERDGFVVSVPNKGFHARPLTAEAIRDLYELRAAVERAAFVLACRRATDAEIEAAAWQQRNIAEAEDGWVRTTLADESFHMSLTCLSQNAQMVAALEGLSSRIRFFRRINLEAMDRRTASFQEHEAIIAALRRRHATAGASLMESHITLSFEHAVEVARLGLARIFVGDRA